MNILVTGAAGFIGSYIVKRLCDAGHQVTGIDNMNNYYDVALKQQRLARLEKNNFNFFRLGVEDMPAMDTLFTKGKFERVIHLAAQAGVRYSMLAPLQYGESNLMGFLTILECCRQHKIKHLCYASSSSVYGLSEKIPFSVDDCVDNPISLYAATKKSNELMAHAYAHLYQLPVTGMRFFTVYGPYGRPDMAILKFANAIMRGQPIDLYNQGNMRRDFTYIDDITEAVVRLMDVIPHKADKAPYQLFNVGFGEPANLLDMVTLLESALGKKAQKNWLPMQPGDVYATYADTKPLYAATGFKPRVNLQEGIGRFSEWFLQDFIRKQRKSAAKSC